MKMSHVHCRVRDLQAAARWFEKVWQVAPVFNNERMVWLSFGELGVILDAAADDSIVTLGFDSKDCDADYRLVTSQGAETIEQPQDKPWGTRTAYLKGPGGRTIEIEQFYRRNLAELSPAQNRIAYYEQCTEAEHCTPTVIVLDLEGHRISSFQPRHQAISPVEPCSSILCIAWLGYNAVSAVCHGNPSMSEYVEIDLSTGQAVRDLVGYNFTVSPNRKEVARVGWVPHFAPPYAKSEYLQIDYTTIYPLPRGMSPVKQKGPAEPPKVVQQKGLLYQGIHEFMPEMYWSADSRRLALVDCVDDWEANSTESQSEGDGEEHNRRRSVVAVSRSGEAIFFGPNGVSEEDLRKLSVSWVNPRQLSLETGSLTTTLTVP